jgi:Formyl transferase
MPTPPHEPQYQTPLLLIGSDGPTTWIAYNRLIREFGLFPAIIEDTVSRRALLRNRARRLGLLPVLSQMAFAALVRPLLRYQASRRIRQLCKTLDLEPGMPMSPAIRHVENINSAEGLQALRDANPQLVIVNGTRILKPATLQAVNASFINTHQGITPQYRGAHGGYWALHERDPKHCGVTVHLVDKGIDTGNIMGQATIAPEGQDNFVTYPYLQMAAALPLLVDTIRQGLQGPLKGNAITGPSNVWYHPGLFQYLKARLRGVR